MAVRERATLRGADIAMCDDAMPCSENLFIQPFAPCSNLSAGVREEDCHAQSHIRGAQQPKSVRRNKVRE